MTAGRLDLERTGEAVGDLVEGVEIAVEQVLGAAQVHPGPGGHPPRPAYSSTGSSDSRPAPRPISSAPGPRAGSSGRYGRSVSSPSTVATASTMSVPGSDPTPVAEPAGHNGCST